MESQPMGNPVIQQPMPMSQPAPLPQQPPTGALPGSINSGAIKVLAVLLLVLAAAKFLSSFFWDSLLVFISNGLSLQAGLVAMFLYGLPVPLVMILTGFAGLSFSRKLRRNGMVGGWLSGCSLADIIAGFTFLASGVFNTLSWGVAAFRTSIASELGMSTVETLNVQTAINSLASLVFVVGLLAAAIIFFVKARASRQMIQRSDLLSVVAAGLLVFYLLVSFVSSLIIAPNLAAMFSSTEDFALLRIAFSVMSTITGLLLLAYYALRAIFWLTNTKKVVSQLGSF